MSNYLYLDDADANQLEPFAEPIGQQLDGLSILIKKPKKFDAQVEDLKVFNRDFDGLILDLLLYQMPNEHGEKANYPGTTLAQHLRTLGTEGTLEEFPIVLWSDKHKLEKAYKSDDSAHDLFDMTCQKGDLIEQDSQVLVACQLESLAAGYKRIREIRADNSHLYKFLGRDSADGLDPRIDEFFVSQGKRAPVHEYARFILNELLRSPGILIDERILASRLGIDVEASSDWAKLKKHLIDSEYKGVFKEGWLRWWSSNIEGWWRSLNDSMPILRSTPAPERVKLLKTYTRLRKLTPAQPARKAYSTDYWTVCQVTDKPIDPRDGLIIDRPNAKPWQDRLYVSLDAELNRDRKLKGLKLDPLDKGRLPRLQMRLHRDKEEPS